MENLLACCGLICESCPVHQATIETDIAIQTDMRISIAQICREQYGMELAPDEITDCDGCTAGGRLFTGCSQCEVRDCVIEKNIENCAWCEEYVCDKLEALFLQDPDAKTRLDSIRI